MKIKLIAPLEQRTGSISSAETFKIQRLCLPLLAGLTPDEHEVSIVDEAFTPDDPSVDVDLVGISVLTDVVRRAYEVADLYARRGVKVVMGGIHPTVLPDEALMHADSVVIGEAEDVWGDVLSDASLGRLKRSYRADKAAELGGRPRPRRDLYANPLTKGYTPLAVGIETSRGCPYDCEFCSIGHTVGRKYRTRPVAEVIAEVESIDSPLFFVDDSLGLNRNHTKKLLAEMIPFGRPWVGQGNASLAEDVELLRLLRVSGCKALLIGFESVQENVQKGMKKIRTLKIDYSEIMRRFHGEGIAILGAFIFGFDHEDKDVFDQTREFIMRHRIDGAQIRILTPFPGTRLYSRLLQEERLIASKWWLQNLKSGMLLFRPKGMTPDQFLNGFTDLTKEIYSINAIVRRFFGMSPRKRKFNGCQLYAGFNLATRKRYLREQNCRRPLTGESQRETGQLSCPSIEVDALVQQTKKS